MKPIHFHCYNPAGKNLFKASANDRAKIIVISCSNSENCQLFKAGKCSLAPVFGGCRCPYGKYHSEEGPTKRSAKVSSWCSNHRKTYEGVGYMRDPVKKMAIVGEHIFLPYAHMNLNEAVPFLEKGHIFSSGSSFMKMPDFTVETILKIVNFHPQAFFGGEIATYQTEEIPKFLTHLREIFPNLFAQLVEKIPGILKAYNLEVISHVGRKALLKTILPCIFTTKGSRDGEYKVTWKWDGNLLKTSSNHVYNSTWGDVKAAAVETMLTPADDATIIIENENQFGPNTILVD